MHTKNNSKRRRVLNIMKICFITHMTIHKTAQSIWKSYFRSPSHHAIISLSIQPQLTLTYGTVFDISCTLLTFRDPMIHLCRCLSLEGLSQPLSRAPSLRRRAPWRWPQCSWSSFLPSTWSLRKQFDCGMSTTWRTSVCRCEVSQEFDIAHDSTRISTWRKGVLFFNSRLMMLASLSFVVACFIGKAQTGFITSLSKRTYSTHAGILILNFIRGRFLFLQNRKPHIEETSDLKNTLLLGLRDDYTRSR